MNDKYVAVAFYLTIIKHQFYLIIDAVDSLKKYSPNMDEVAALLIEIDHKIEVEGEKLMKSIRCEEFREKNENRKGEYEL